MADRRQEACAVRLEAAEMARSCKHPQHTANGEEQRYAGAKYFMSFTKRLPHNPDTGLLEAPQDFVEFRRAIDEAFIDMAPPTRWSVGPSCPPTRLSRLETCGNGRPPPPGWCSLSRARTPRR